MKLDVRGASKPGEVMGDWRPCGVGFDDIEAVFGKCGEILKNVVLHYADGSYSEFRVHTPTTTYYVQEKDRKMPCDPKYIRKEIIDLLKVADEVTIVEAGGHAARYTKEVK